MSHQVTNNELSRFGRILSLLLNRSMMYRAGHPYAARALDECYPVLEKLLDLISPLVFAMNRDQFFVDEEPLDPRVNTKKILTHFKKTGIESISFYRGLTRDHMRRFLEIFVSRDKYPDVKAMRRALLKSNIGQLKINHVFYRKVTADDEVVSRGTLGARRAGSYDEAKRNLVEMVLGNALKDELSGIFNLQDLIEDPDALSKAMIKADLQGGAKHDAPNPAPGRVLAVQLQKIQKEAETAFSAKEVDLSSLAEALCELKARLLEAMKAQKDLNVIYSNEAEIVSRADRLTDRVVLELIRKEYREGAVSARRLAQILKRLLPDPRELRRLLPGIKQVLLDEGMTMEAYGGLVKELGLKLKGDDLAKVLHESSEAVGIEGDRLIQEIMGNPVQAASLVCLAAEIKKGTGDDTILFNFLLECIEKVGASVLSRASSQVGGDQTQIAETIRHLGRSTVQRLREMPLENELVAALEKRIDRKLETLLEQSAGPAAAVSDKTTEQTSLLQILEQSVDQDSELGGLLKQVRTMADGGRVDPDSFQQIHQELFNQWADRPKHRDSRLPERVLGASSLLYVIGNEIDRNRRYGLPFSALGLSVVKVQQRNGLPTGAIGKKAVTDAVLGKCAHLLRDVDIVGELGPNRIIAILPLTGEADARFVLRRLLRALHGESIRLQGARLHIKMAGVAASFNAHRTEEVNSFVKMLIQELLEKAARVRNIQVLF